MIILLFHHFFLSCFVGSVGCLLLVIMDLEVDGGEYDTQASKQASNAYGQGGRA
jgi:hypothetical protein